MIRRIEQIKAFGVFADLRWPATLPDFKQFNLIYGWNYSGKTTLSRAFRCFEQKRPHADFADAQVELKSEDGTAHHLSSPQAAPLFRVFNSDFVHENLAFDEGIANPILVLGSEDIARLEKLDAKKAERESTAVLIEANKQKKDEKEKKIERAFTKDARDLIKNPLSVPNYDKTHFEREVTACKETPNTYLLKDKALQKWLSVYCSTDKKPELSTKVVSLCSVGDLVEKSTALLKRVVTTNAPIPRLKENPILENWVNDGRPLHEGESTCQFCGQLLPPALLSHLTGHFSADYENLMSELDILLNAIQVAQDQQLVLDHRSDFYAELSERFIDAKNRLDEHLKVRSSALEALEKILIAKRTKAFTSLLCPVVEDPAHQIATAIEEINAIIAEHNKQTTQFDKRRREAFSNLERHYAASFVLDQHYSDHLQEMVSLNAIITEQNEKLFALDGEIRDLEKAVCEASKGAERINELLGLYFGKNDLRIVVSADNRFQITRANVVARNLSEGEKTAIAFAYFVIHVQDGKYPSDGLIVVIDDPISSLDANHLFNTYALIKTQLADYRQLFVSTHSFEFYNLIREWVAEDEGKDHAKKPQAGWKKWGIFLVRRTVDGTSALEEIPRELLRFKSEYHYLFSILCRFHKTRSGDFDCIFNLPNIVRRFMEAFGGIMIPLSTGLKGKMTRLFTNEVERERVWKFINHYSHNATITRSLNIPDTSECVAVVDACLNAVRAWDDEYFSDLEKEVTG